MHPAEAGASIGVPMDLNGTAAVARHQADLVSPAITREAGSTLTLSPAERAVVAAELAGLSTKVATLAAARLDCLHAALAAPITQVSAVPAGRAAAGLVTASEARPWQ